MRWIKPYFPHSHGVPRVDDQRVISGIIFVIGNGLRWSRLEVFSKIFAELAAKGGRPNRLMMYPSAEGRLAA